MKMIRVLKANELELYNVFVGGYHRLFCDANSVEEAAELMFDDDSADIDVTQFGEAKYDKDGELLNFEELDEKARKYYLENAEEVANYGDRQGMVKVYRQGDKYFSDAWGNIEECPKYYFSDDEDDWEYYVRVPKNGGYNYVCINNTHIQPSMYDVPKL